MALVEMLFIDWSRSPLFKAVKSHCDVSRAINNVHS